jgi:DNA-binding response OmpR family regulator
MHRLLIVDDDESMRRLLRFRLKNAYEIIDTGSAEEVVALALEHKPDAILLDVLLPQYSGLEICQALSAMSFTQTIPIFFISGKPANGYTEFCREVGAKGFFQKPLDFDVLTANLAKVLNGKTAERRSEPRIRLRVVVRIRGTTEKGEHFEFLAVTENVSAHGFCSDCSIPLAPGAVVDVCLAKGQQSSVKARVVHVQRSGTPAQRCGFRFVDSPIDWILR